MNPLLMTSDFQLLYVWEESRIEGQAILVLLVLFSIVAWTVMASKALQMRRARRLNLSFRKEYRAQQKLLDIYHREPDVAGCPLYTIYLAGCTELKRGILRARVTSDDESEAVNLQSIEHVKRALERSVAEQSLALESNLIMLAITVSGSPFLGLLGTVWGVMSTFADVGQEGSADLTTMAPGVASALMTTVAGLLVAIPSMFGYNWLLHHLRVLSVEMDNFAYELVSGMEIVFLKDQSRPRVDLPPPLPGQA